MSPVLSKDFLLPIVFTDWAAAKDESNNDKSGLILFLRHKPITESMVSPAPILSIAVFENASQ